MACGSEWWYGFLSKMESTSIRDGLASRGPIWRVRSKARWQYEAYFPISVFVSALRFKCNRRYQRSLLLRGANRETVNASNCQPWTKVKGALAALLSGDDEEPLEIEPEWCRWCEPDAEDGGKAVDSFWKKENSFIRITERQGWLSDETIKA